MTSTGRLVACLRQGIAGRLPVGTCEKDTTPDGQVVRDIVAVGKPHGRLFVMTTAARINIPLSPRTNRNHPRFIETALARGRY